MGEELVTGHLKCVMTDRDKDSQKVMKSKQETMNKQAERRRDSVRPIKPGVMNRKPMPAKAIKARHPTLHGYTYIMYSKPNNLF